MKRTRQNDPGGPSSSSSGSGSSSSSSGNKSRRTGSASSSGSTSGPKGLPPTRCSAYNGNPPCKRSHSTLVPVPKDTSTHLPELVGMPVSPHVRRAGHYLLGPRLGSSPVKSIVQCLARKEGTEEYYMMKILTLSGKLCFKVLLNMTVILHHSPSKMFCTRIFLFVFLFPS